MTRAVNNFKSTAAVFTKEPISRWELSDVSSVKQFRVGNSDASRRLQSAPREGGLGPIVEWFSRIRPNRSDSTSRVPFVGGTHSLLKETLELLESLRDTDTQRHCYKLLCSNSFTSTFALAFPSSFKRRLPQEKSTALAANSTGLPLTELGVAEPKHPGSIMLSRVCQELDFKALMYALQWRTQGWGPDPPQSP
ncbi:hypothetical protein TNCV_4456231 [Trichonephila clavipes]|nr:hypothetical protein TNCV_4456231 [Trichonephila clavipes]